MPVPGNGWTTKKLEGFQNGQRRGSQKTRDRLQEVGVMKALKAKSGMDFGLTMLQILVLQFLELLIIGIIDDCALICPDAVHPPKQPLHIVSTESPDFPTVCSHR